MRNLQIRIGILSLFFSLFGSQTFFAQEGKTTVQQSPKFEELLNEKRKIGASIAMSDGYKIQIYNGTSSESRQKLAEFRREFKEYDGTIHYSSPMYKVYVGPFKSRLQAEGALEKIKAKFPASLLIKP